MTTLEVLEKARALIDAPEKWVKGNYSATKNGRECFCMAGAVRRVVADGDEAHRERLSAYRALAAGIESPAFPWSLDSIIAFNDAKGRRHSQVLKVFDRAIERAKAGTP